MLENTLNTRFEVGTNLSGGLASADWRYLLPRLRYDRVLCLSAPAVTSLPVLENIAETVLVTSCNLPALRKLVVACRNLDIRNVKCLLVAEGCKLPVRTGSFDLIFAKNSRLQESREEVERALNVHGTIYQEESKRGTIWRDEEDYRADSFWLTPFSGKMRTAVPLHDQAISKYFFDKVLYGNSLKKRTLSKIGKALTTTGLLAPAVPRRATVLHRKSTSGNMSPLPQYLCAPAEDAGIKLDGFRCGLSTRGLGNSNKAIFYLFEGSADKPEIVIKITRAKEFNYRLENEFRLLALLRERCFVPEHSVPEPLFLSYHNELAVMGMRAVEGSAFRKRTQASPNCPIAHDALEWLVQLARNSAVTTVTSTEVACALRKLFNRFCAIYQLPGNYVEFLEEQIVDIEVNDAAFPLVLQHGDPGTWNMLVSDKDKVIVIDWESGEPQGMPLWDLFYFFRTYASWVSRMQGSRDSLKNFADQFLCPTPLASLFLEVTAKYCAATNLDRRFIRPLFYTCWMHRALKEAMRLTPETLQSGNYVNLLRMVIDRSDADLFTQLFALQVNSSFKQEDFMIQE